MSSGLSVPDVMTTVRKRLKIGCRISISPAYCMPPADKTRRTCTAMEASMQLRCREATGFCSSAGSHSTVKPREYVDTSVQKLHRSTSELQQGVVLPVG